MSGGRCVVATDIDGSSSSSRGREAGRGGGGGVSEGSFQLYSGPALFIQVLAQSFLFLQSAQSQLDGAVSQSPTKDYAGAENKCLSIS